MLVHEIRTEFRFSARPAVHHPAFVLQPLLKPASAVLVPAISMPLARRRDIVQLRSPCRPCRTVRSIVCDIVGTCKRQSACAFSVIPRISTQSGGSRLRQCALPLTIRMNSAKRTAIFERLRAANPEPRGELEYRNAFELLVAVVLSAQATDKSVNLATRELYAAANTPAAILKLGAAGLETYIKRIGLYRTKAKNILATCRLLLDQHRRRSAGHARRTRAAAGRRPQDRQRGAQYRVRPSDDRGRHAHLSRRQPHRASRPARTWPRWKRN